MPTYQVLKALINQVPELKLDWDNFMVVSPDEGAMSRNMYYASVLGVNLGMFLQAARLLPRGERPQPHCGA